MLITFFLLILHCRCDYWVPPPEPTPAPTPSCHTQGSTIEAGAGGLVLGVLCTLVAYKFFGNGRRGYTEIPH